jgi:hypothetical protein
MTSLSETLRDAAARFPAQRLAFDRLGTLIAGSGEHVEFTFNRLLELLQPVSVRELNLICATLVASGAFEMRLRVQAPGSGALGDFQDLDEIPEEIYDFHTDNILFVTDDIISVVYLVRERE